MFTRIITFLSCAAVLGLWACAACVYIDPQEWRYIGFIGLTFPLWVAAVGAMVAVCAVFKPRRVWIPLVGLLGCCGTLRDYCPVNLSSPPPKGCIKVMSYNIMSFGYWARDDDGRLAMPRQLCETRSDIMNLQEAAFRNAADRDEVIATMRQYGYHYDWAVLGDNTVACASRYPIVRHEAICHSVSNGAAAFYLTPSPRDTIVVVNAHLESMHLSAADRSQYHQLIKNPEEADTIKGKRTILSKIARAAHERARQATAVADFIDRHKGYTIILTGDFNDTPVSFAHHLVCERLTDAFRATGNGIGRSFNKDGIYVRIDNIFCSAHFKPFACQVDDAMTLSDHYPIVAFLKPVTPQEAAH